MSTNNNCQSSFEPCDHVKRVAILVSGKRKSGKDFVADRLTKILQERIGAKVVQLRIAESLKRRYAEIHGVDGDRLMGTSEYKEIHRVKMIEWSENERTSTGDYCLFCRAAMESALTGPSSDANVWIVVDCRRHFEVNFFLQGEAEGRRRGSIRSAITLRVTATEQTRQNRGWYFIKGADDIDSECGLDDWPKWDFVVDNNDSTNLNGLDCQLGAIVDAVSLGLAS